jgi:hypothetical protein
MAALTAERQTEQYGESPAPETVYLPVAASTKVFAGALVCIDTNGRATEGETATTLISVGRAELTVDNSTGSAGAKSVTVRKGAFWYANSTSTDAISAPDRYSTCYVVDDQTVAKTTGGTTRSAAGKVLDIDSTKGVLVLFGW